MYSHGMYGLSDPTFLLVILGSVISEIASAYVNSTFRRYDQVRSKNNVTGTQAAQYILQNQQINNIGVQQIAGDLVDNYNSGNKMLSLFQATAQSTSAAAIGVAARECEYAVQDVPDYVPLKTRATLVPTANFGSTIPFLLIIVGILFSWNSMLTNIRIFAFSLALLFQLVTLLVEFNVSWRAIQTSSEGGLLTGEEAPMVRHTLFAVTLTYVAAALSTPHSCCA